MREQEKTKNILKNLPKEWAFTDWEGKKYFTIEEMITEEIIEEVQGILHCDIGKKKTFGSSQRKYCLERDFSISETEFKLENLM